MPLITRWSSTLGSPRVSVGGSENYSSVSQKQFRFICGLPLETVNHRTTVNGILRIGLDPDAPSGAHGIDRRFCCTLGLLSCILIYGCMRPGREALPTIAPVHSGQTDPGSDLCALAGGYWFCTSW
jgi:hypothetical protein